MANQRDDVIRHLRNMQDSGQHNALLHEGSPHIAQPRPHARPGGSSGNGARPGFLPMHARSPFMPPTLSTPGGNGQMIEQSQSPVALPPSTVPPTPDGSHNPYLIPDGFSYNMHLKYLPYRAFPMQLRMLDDYRRQALTGLWYPRWYTAPEDSTIQVQAGDTISPVLRVARGSVLWGTSLVVLTPGTPTSVRVTITDTCSNQLITSQDEIGSMLTSNFTTGTPRAGYGLVFLSGGPLRLSGPELGVTIANTDVVNNLTVQLLLLMLEPAGMPR